jgi:hypothetical protein
LKNNETPTTRQSVNSNPTKLHPYPFERLRLLFKDLNPDPRDTAINLGIGEPKHLTPEFIRQTLIRNLSGLASYPVTAGTSVVSGNLPSAGGKYSLYCALIVKRVDATTGLGRRPASTNCSVANDGIARAQRRVGPLRPTGLSRGPLKGERVCLQ